MRLRSAFALPGFALTLCSANLMGQTAATPAPASPPTVTAVPTECCPPKSCEPCPIKSFCDHFKCAPINKCASAPAPQITVIVPPPKVVYKTPCAPKTPAPPLAPRTAAPPAAPTAATQPYLVPQMTYTMQPVVTMQAVPTMSYGVVHGPAQPVGAVPYAAAPLAAPYPAAPLAAPTAPQCPPCPPAAPLSPFGDVEAVVKVIRLLKEVSGLGTPANDSGTDLSKSIASLDAKLDAEILKTRKDLLELSAANRDRVLKVVEALEASRNLDEQTKVKLRELLPKKN